MSTTDKKPKNWFQLPGFDASSFLPPNTSFSQLQDWLKSSKLMEPPALWPNSRLFPDLNKAGMGWYAMATEQLQTSFAEYWKLMGLVPQNEYDRLLEQYNAIKYKIGEEQKKEKKSTQDDTILKETQKALKMAESQIRKLEDDLKKTATKPVEAKVEAKTDTNPA